MPPKFKYTKEEMINAALGLARKKGIDGITARDLAKELGVSTQPVFTSFSGMDELKRETFFAAEKIYDKYAEEGLKEKIPFLGFGKAYIRFAKTEPQLYKSLFLSDFSVKSGGAAAAVKRSQQKLRPWITGIYKVSEEEADVYFRDLWLVAHAIATLFACGGCAYTDEEIEQILSQVSVSLCKSIKEIKGFASGNFDKNEVFEKLIFAKEKA